MASNCCILIVGIRRGFSHLSSCDLFLLVRLLYETDEKVMLYQAVPSKVLFFYFNRRRMNGMGWKARRTDYKRTRA